MVQSRERLLRDAQLMRELAGARRLQIIRARVQDLDAIAALEGRVFGLGAYQPADIAAFHERFGDLTFVALDAGGAIVGHAIGGARANPAHELDGAGWVNSLAVAPEHRRHGIAGALLGVLLGALRSRGLARVMLYTEHEREAALALYRAFGFIECEDPHPSGLERLTLILAL